MDIMLSPYIHRWKNPFSFQYQRKNFSASGILRTEHQLRYHFLSTLQALLTSDSASKRTIKAATSRSKLNSSCNQNQLPPTQEHSLWTSHSPCCRLTLNMPYWTPLENNSSIGNFQGTGCEKTKNISLAAATHIICHSLKRTVIHRGFFPSLLKSTFIVCD